MGDGRSYEKSYTNIINFNYGSQRQGDDEVSKFQELICVIFDNLFCFIIVFLSSLCLRYQWVICYVDNNLVLEYE